MTDERSNNSTVLRNLIEIMRATHGMNNARVDLWLKSNSYPSKIVKYQLTKYEPTFVGTP